MHRINVYVLTSLSLDTKGNIESRNVGVTFSLHQAEHHRAKGVENEFQSFELPVNWREQAATTDLVLAMRGLCAMVEELQDRVRIEEFGHQ